MSRLTNFKIITTLLFTLLLSSKGIAQEATVTFEQDDRIEQLLKERKRLLKNGELKGYYSIQVFSGEISGAQKILKNCKSMFTDYKSQIEYQTPNYKVWIGKFRNQLDADRALMNISTEYEGAFVFKPKNKMK